MGVAPWVSRMGPPIQVPGQDWGIPQPEQHIACTGYVAGGMPLAFLQPNFMQSRPFCVRKMYVSGPKLILYNGPNKGQRLVTEGSVFVISPNCHFWLGGGPGTQLSTFDAESKSAKIPNSLYGGGGIGPNFQLLMPSSNLLKSQIPFEGGGGLGSNF